MSGWKYFQMGLGPIEGSSLAHFGKISEKLPSTLKNGLNRTLKWVPSKNIFVIILEQMDLMVLIS